ncbi:MAG: ATP-binding protein [Anaerolineae bacterium]|nr:GAF domain-containing protein [Anaerolineae bacterium]
MTRRPIAPWLPWVYGGLTILLLVILASELAAPAFDFRAIFILSLMMALLLLTLLNVRVYNRVESALKHRVLQLSALSEISKELFLTLNQEQVYKLVLDRAFEATGAQSGIIVLYDTPNEPHIVARRNEGKVTTGGLVSLEVFKQALKLGKPITDDEGPFANGMKRRLIAPIKREDTSIAVIVLESRRSNAFLDDDLSFMAQLAAQAGIVIENARMFDWIQESRNRLQVILDSMGDAVVVFDVDGKVALANPKVAELLNLNPNLVINEHVWRLLERSDLHFAEKLGFAPEAMRALFLDATDEAVGSGPRVTFKSISNQPRYVERTIAPVIGLDGRTDGLVMVFSDVTEEEQLAQQREDLSRMIVHDLRSPLTAMNASMKLLGELSSRENSNFARTIQRTTETSQRALRKVLNMINSLLDLAKMESGTMTLEPEYHLLRPMAEAVRAELMPLAEELDIQIIIDMPDEIPPVKIESDKIERVLLNLVDNALKFSPIGGTIRIQVRQENSEFVRVEVIDNGPGVPNDQKQHIFERFRQVEGTKGNRGGTGLGLTFAQMAVQAHGGEIWIENNPDGGSIFVFTLPAAVVVMQDEQ